MQDQSPIKVVPGAASPSLESLSLTYLPTAQTWVTGDQVTINVLAVSAAGATITCSDYSEKAPMTAAAMPSNFSASFSSSSPVFTWTVPAPSTPVVLYVSALNAATLGDYTMCLGAWSNASNDTARQATVARVQLTPWIQIGMAPPSAAFAGDVHSNGPIANLFIPSSSYFYTSGFAGIVSSTGSITMAATQISSPGAPDWLLQNYSFIPSSPYSRLYSSLATVPTTENISATTIATHCTNSDKGVYRVTAPTTNPFFATDLSFAACSNTHLIYFIEGDVHLDHNITIPTASGTITFVVNGNIFVNPSVTQLDGMYIFSGTFDDGASSSALSIRGSLIGLGGDTSSSANTNSFWSQASSRTTLQRDLGVGNQSGPAEAIFYEPKYVYMIKDLMGSSKFSWSE